MLQSHDGKVTVKIDGIAASAGSVIAMAGDEIIMSPVSMLMIHNPSTIAVGDREDIQKVIEMLDEVKESIINAYENKTKLPRNKISNLMDGETWMNANKAIELGFADKISEKNNSNLGAPNIAESFSQVQVMNSLISKVTKKCTINKKERKVKSSVLNERLDLIKNWR